MKPPCAIFRLILLCLLALIATQRADATQYATWIMLWCGHDQSHWWKPDQSWGAKVMVGGKWQSIDWADPAQMNEFLDNIKTAGVTIVIADLTNGWGWLNDRVHQVQALCAKKGLKLCVAENCHGDAKVFESRARDVWNLFAGPSAPCAATYLYKDGKPLIVEYATRDWFKAVNKGMGPFRQKFTVAWASGEDSDVNKWGWQLEPWIGTPRSSDTMFVTPAIKWNMTDELRWRKSLAWLDYNFARARQANPAFIVVGSYDDPAERNGWLVADTSGCVPGLQMRDQTGALSTTAFYRRVKEWIAGKPSAIPGGALADGCYRLINHASDKALNVAGGDGVAGARLIQWPPCDQFNNYFWFYHLGGNTYRILSLNSGLSLTAPDDSKDGESQIIQSWSDNIDVQKWTMQPAGKDFFQLKNRKTGKVLDVAAPHLADGLAVIQSASTSSTTQLWRADPILLLPSPAP